MLRCGARDAGLCSQLPSGGGAAADDGEAGGAEGFHRRALRRIAAQQGQHGLPEDAELPPNLPAGRADLPWQRRGLLQRRPPTRADRASVAAAA